MWVVFLPTYYMTFYAQHQAALLAFCLVVNGACILICLFLPKIYAVYFVDEKNMRIRVLRATGSISTMSVDESQTKEIK